MMKVFKFGGASIKNATAIRNMCEIIRDHQTEQLIVVVSAMGKSTNALEKIYHCVLDNKSYNQHIKEFILFHRDIATELFGENKAVNQSITKWSEILQKVAVSKFESNEQFYDAVVSIGELLSSTIIGLHLNQSDVKTLWTDVRQLIITDSAHREAIVDWEVTGSNICDFIDKNNKGQIILTQGFIASSDKGHTTTLGREGSDYTGAIFASCLKSESFTVWKDVPGILNADPKRINDAILFQELGYNEASEMTYYGAKVIHPKTIKPLANQNIPLYVRCFDSPSTAGTKIHQSTTQHDTPIIIFKENQCLVSFKSKDLTFVNEEGISVIFKSLHELSIDMHIMQNSAVSFSICIDYHEGKVEKLIKKLEDHFFILYNTGLELTTIKTYTEEAINKYRPSVEILLEQKSRNNYRVLMGK